MDHPAFLRTFMQRVACSAVLFGLLLIAAQATGQTILNGSFEENAATGCAYNLSNADFNALIQSVHGFGGSSTIAGELDLHTTGCYVTPQAGSWCVGLDSDAGSNDPDALALELSAPLTPGATYTLTYYVYANTNFGRMPIGLNVGESLVNSDFGTLLSTTQTIANTWLQVQVTFAATRPTRYITVRSQVAVEGWVQVDNFRLTQLTGRADDLQLPAPLALYPNPAAGATVTVQRAETLREANFELLDATGRVVRRGTWAAAASVLDIADLPRGCYHLLVRSGGREVRTKLIRI